MRNTLSALIISALMTTSAFAGQHSIEQDVAALGKLAMGYRVEVVTGKTAEEILTNYIQMNDEDAQIVNKEYNQMSDADEVDSGFTSTKSAIDMAEFATTHLLQEIEYMDDEVKADEIRVKITDLGTKWAPIIQSLSTQGVKFGYSGNGPGYCGVNFIQMYIVSPKESRVYSVYFSYSGPC